MAALNSFSSRQDAELKAHPTPLGGILMLRTLTVGVRAVQTDGLPEDLKAAYLDLVGVMNKFDDLFTGWPDKPQDAQGYLRRRASEDPNYVNDFTTKLNTLLKQMDPVRVKLDEMSKKYGFDNMNGGAAPK
ncbi:MAG: hypothetical protein P4L99_05195 [Chthoniobacter sp.]|nr:hypothetical protein [Chthoniobacter sp.]